MKKLTIVFAIMFTAIFAHAQQTVIVQRPGILTDLVGAAGALIELPVALAEGIAVGTAEAAGALINGSTSVYVVPQAPVATTPVVTAVPGYTTPIVMTPAPVAKPVPVVPAAPPVLAVPVPAAPPAIPTVVPSSSVTITSYSPSGVVSVTRPVSAYETGNITVPVPVEHRVGSSPFVNPYVYRPW
jgi:hypothetical protein